MNEILSKIIEKFTSGRFIFTVITALVFAYAVYKGIIDGEKITSIVMLVLTFYFAKGQISKEGGNG